MCFKRKPKKICDLCLYRESCTLPMADGTYCEQFRHRSQGENVLCLSCRHNVTCRFGLYAKCLYCQFYRKK